MVSPNNFNQYTQKGKGIDMAQHSVKVLFFFFLLEKTTRIIKKTTTNKQTFSHPIVCSFFRIPWMGNDSLAPGLLNTLAFSSWDIGPNLMSHHGMKTLILNEEISREKWKQSVWVWRDWSHILCTVRLLVKPEGRALHNPRELHTWSQKIPTWTFHF